MSDPTYDADLIVLGAGSGGYSCALRAAQLGAKVLLIEADKVGGTCLHRGCIPTKAMLHAAELADAIRRAPSLGVEATGGGIDIDAVNSFKTGVVQRLHRGLALLIEARGIRLVRGVGILTAPDAVAVGDQRFRAPQIVLATGSRPRAIPGLEIQGHIITSDQALALDWIPRTALILGGGAIGVEFASLWRSFGAQVAVVEALDRLLPAEDEAVSTALARAFRRRGIATKTGVTVAQAVEDASGLHVTLSDGTTVDTDVLLVAAGRVPNTEGLGLELLGVRVEDGYVQTDERCHTGVADVWAVGDIVPGLQLAHRGFAQGIAVAERIAGVTVPPLVESGIPRIAYCEPEVASVGLTEAQAVARYGKDGVSVEDQSLGANARSLILGTTGLVKAVRRAGGPVLGVHIVGARASELIASAQLMVNWEAYPEEVAALIQPHPTQSEALGEALLALSGKALHTQS